MKIVLAWPMRLKTVPMGNFARMALEKLGHEVICFDISRSKVARIADNVGRSLGATVEEAYVMNRSFRNMAERLNPDLVIAIFGFHLSAESLLFLKANNINRFCWWINDPFQFERSMTKAKLYDRVFTNSSVCVDWYRSRDISNATFLPVGICPSVHKTVAPSRELACDICFAGDWNPQREYFVGELNKRFRVKVLGPWKKKIAGDSPLQDALVGDFFSAEEMTNLFCSSQIVFNLHAWYNRWDHGVNPRLFEAAGSGKVQCVDHKIEIPKLFPESSGNPMLSCFNGLDDLIESVKTLLKSPGNLSRMGLESHDYCLKHHTYEHRMTEMLSFL